MGIGRPTDYREEYDALATKYCMLGATNANLAAFFDCAESTIDNWMNAHPSFMDAIKEGREVADANVASRLYSRAMGYTHQAEKIFADAKTGEVLRVDTTEHYPPETAAAIFWLKNRRPDMWRDKRETVMSGDNFSLVVNEKAK